MRLLVVMMVMLLGPAPVGAAALADLGWLTGHWVGSKYEGLEEVWLEPRDGSLPGTMRWVMANGRQVLEYLVIQQADDDVVLRFKHYDVDFTPWEKGEPNTYRLTSAVRGMARFERTSADPRAPRVMVYERVGDALTFTAWGEEGEAPGLRLEFRLNP